MEGRLWKEAEGFPRHASACVCLGEKSHIGHLLACVAAGPRTRLNHLYSLYTEGLECLRRRLLFKGARNVPANSSETGPQRPETWTY